MSRLIDADKVRTIIVDEMWNVDDLPHDEQQAVIKACYSIWERIEKRALIGDAIPIEYMKQWANDRLRENWFADHPSIIARLIVDWEKENEGL